MRSAGGISRLSLVIAIALMTLLPFLAVLQYRWIGQVSEAGRDRLRGTLGAATGRFRQEFNSEFARAYGSFQTGRRSARSEELEDYGERFSNWSAASPYRNLILNFYATRGDDLLVFDRANNRFEPAPWPERFARLRTGLQSRSQDESRPPFGGAIDPEIPAIVAPRLHFSSPPAFAPPEPGRRGLELAGWTIAELNLPYIEKEFLPELIQKHFGQPNGLDYQLQIVSKSNPGKVIYRSDPKSSQESFQTADATVSLLELRPDLSRGFPSQSGARGTKGGFRYRPAGLPPDGAPDDRGAWRLMARHRAGSLETAVLRARNRNLGISFAILLLMGASIGMLVVSTQRAQRLARLQMEFVAGVSHELRTPLTVICSAGDNLADGLVAKGPQVQRYGSVIRNEGRRLSEMVEQILGFTGMQSGRTKYDLQPTEVAGIINRALAACGPEVVESACQVDRRIEPGLPPVMADATSLTHCLRNLVSNALKYGNGGEWIGLRAHMATPTQLEISVEDRGAGIDADDLPHIFEPFYRGGKAVAAQIHGAGLGLSLVKRIIEAHGGSVKVASTPGQGTCFALHLPVAPSPAEQPAAERVES